MHLLATRSGAIDDGSEAADLGQTPGDVVVLSAADTDLAGLATARARRPAGAASLRLANIMRLQHHLSVDLYAEEIVAKARLVVVRLIGGVAYWPYGIEQVVAACRENRVALACVPGDDTPDADLMGRSTLPDQAVHRIWRYLQEGGPENVGQMLAYADGLLDRDAEWREPAPIPRAGLYWPGLDRPDLAAIRARWPTPDAPAVPIVFYRALVQAGQLAPVDALVAAADDLVGYDLYLDLLGPAAAHAIRHAFPLGAEEERARFALDLAAQGRSVALYRPAIPASMPWRPWCSSCWTGPTGRTGSGSRYGSPPASPPCRPLPPALAPRSATISVRSRCPTCSRPGRRSRAGSGPRRKAISWWRSTTRSPGAGAPSCTPRAASCWKTVRPTPRWCWPARSVGPRRP